MRQARTFAAHSPWRDIFWQFALLAVVSLIALLCDWSCSAHAGEYKRLRKEARITVLRPIRARGRADAGYPVLQIGVNVTRIGVNLSGLINPIGWFF